MGKLFPASRLKVPSPPTHETAMRDVHQVREYVLGSVVFGSA